MFEIQNTESHTSIHSLPNQSTHQIKNFKMCGRIKSFVVQLASIPTHIPKTWHSTLYPYSSSHLTSTIHSPFSPMLLYFPLSPSYTIYFLLRFNSNFLAMNYESSIDRKKKIYFKISYFLICIYLAVANMQVSLLWVCFG